MILSYDLLKNDNNANTKETSELNNKEKPPELELLNNISNDSSSQDPKTNPLQMLSLSGSDLSKREDFFIQKDLLKMINSFSGNEAEELRHSFNSLRLHQSMNSDNNDLDNNNVFESEWNDNKVIDIQTINSFESDDEPKEKVILPIKNDNEIHQLSYKDNDKTSPIKKTVNKQAILTTYMTFDNYELAKWSFLLSKDQKACIYLQSKLDEDNDMPELLYHNLKEKIIDLMYGGFSNYFIQKLIDKLSKKYIEEIIIQIIKSNSFSILGLDPHGTRVIQKILERVKKTNKLLGIITTSLLQNINQFIFDANANHIIIKYASIISYPRNQVIYDFLISNMLNISHDKNACCTLQKCIEVANESQREDLFIAISQNAKVMISDDFGNYAIQFIIPLCSKKILDEIVLSFLECADVFALNKHASNVIEKCLEYCTEDIRLVIIKKFMNEQSIMNLLFNKYGNYVLQTIISYSTEPWLSVILGYIEKYSKQLNGKKFGQKFWSKLRKIYPQLNKNDYGNYSNSGNNSRIWNHNSTTMMSSEQQSQYKKQQKSQYQKHQQQQSNYMQYQPSNMMMMSDSVQYNKGNSNNNMIMGREMPQMIQPQQQQQQPMTNPMMMNMNNYNSGNNLKSNPYNSTTHHQNPFYSNDMNNNTMIPSHQMKTPSYPIPNSSLKSKQKQPNPHMNISIAVNNYYTSPIYNYYCFPNG